MADRRRPTDEATASQRLLQELSEARQRVIELESVLLEEISRAKEAALKRTERELRLKEAVIEASVAGLALWDLQGRIRYVNPAFLAMWGYDRPEEVESSNISDLLADDPKVATIGPSLEHVGGWIGKLKAIGKDGSPFTVMVSVSLVEDPKETPSRAVGSFVEMTYRERLNAMLFRQSDWLEAVHAIDHGILAGENLEEIGDASLVALRELIPCAGCSVTLFNLQNGEAALLAAAPGPNSSRDRVMVWVPLDSFEETVQALHREEIYIADRDLGLPLPASVLGSSDTPESKTYALVPLRCEGELLGSLNLALEQSDRPTSLHKSILRQVADSLTVAVRNAQLKTAVTDLAEQLQALGANRAGPHET